jgi:PAS domain S-box-containing protein
MPLLDDQDQIVGLLILMTFLEQQVAQLEAEKIKLLANYTTAIEQQVNQRTAEIKAQAEREQLVFKIALGIRQSLQLEEILETTVAGVRQLLNADRVLIYQFQPDKNGIIVTESVLPGWTVALGSQIQDTCFQYDAGGDHRAGKTRAIADIYQAGLTTCHIQSLERFEVKANLVAPILVRGELWGLLISHQCSAPRQWQATELNLLDQLVVQIAIAIQQATAYQQLVAERQQIEATLRASEQRYATLTEMSPVGIFQADAVGHCLYVNERWCQIAGLRPEEAAGWGWVNGIHPEDRGFVLTAWYAAAEASHPFRLEYRFQNAAGDVTWVIGQAVAERGVAGETVGYIGTITDITDIKQAEVDRFQSKKLRLELTLLENILDNILAGYWDADLVNNKQYISPGFKKMFGYEDDELPNSPETWKQLVFSEDLPKAIEGYTQHVQSLGKIPYYNELRYHHKNGSTVWVICTGRVVEWDHAGKPLRLIGCHIDITQRKQAEEQLRKSDAHLKTAQRIGKLGSWEFDLPTEQIAWSDEVFRIFGRDLNAGLPSFGQLQQQLHPDDRDFHQQIVQTAIETLQPYEIEYRLYRPDGTLRYVQARGEPFVDASGQLVQLVGTVLDITDRKLAEAQLRDLSDRLTLAVKSGAIAIWDWDIPHNILDWDERMYELYGITPEQFTSVYDAWINRVHPDDRPRTETAIQQALAGEQDYDHEFRVVHPDGTIRFIKAYAMVQRTPQGESQRMIGINFDITERKQAELTLLHTSAQLAASNRELEAFAYSVSHDLRSPLRAIDGFSKALLEDYGDQIDAEGQDYFNRIRHNVKRMGMLIDDLLRLSRVSRSEMQYSAVNLSVLVQEQVHELQTADPDRQVTVRVAPAVTVLADLTLMRVVVSNLLQNAWKFTSHRPHAAIEFGVMQRDGQPTYFVRDDGAGFDMAYANLLFGVFQRLHNTNEFPGTGIGLATVQRILHRHGGQVWAEGAVGQGATIYFTVPNPPLKPGT